MTTTPESSSASKLNVDFATLGPWSTAALRGELNMSTAPVLIDQVGELIARQAAPRVALDLSGVAFCDSSGINALVRLYKRAAARDGELVLLRPAPRMAELLFRTGMDQCVRVCERLPEV